MEKSIQKDKVIITQTKNKKYESEVASIYSTFSRNSRKVSRQRQSTIEKYQKHDNNLGSYYIASSHDGAFVATFNTETYELVYYKTENLQTSIPVKHPIQRDINSPITPSNLCVMFRK
ncbi:16461_t:CDS:2 [Entrophospora sp. SA101]|nr:16461_t:CDS:2 [Entrophospora sp. SA101]